MLKILHTSDWHIGKKIYGNDLASDHKLFFKWLIETIKEHRIDAILVSGDIFDLSNPSVESRTIYYDILVELQKADCQVIITGGNHDSPMVLNAPRELLKALNISVIGKLTENISDTFIPVKNRMGEVEAIIVAVPYLREYDLKMNISIQSFNERIEELQKATCQLYNNLANEVAMQFPNMPLFAMGHFMGVGSTISDSERELQIGNLNALEISKLTEGFDYLALGHIHRPQQLKSSVPAIYSGAPISLSFSEFDDRKVVRLIEVDNSKISNIVSIEIPKFRKLERIKGSFDGVLEKLENLKSSDYQLQTLIELEFVEETRNPILDDQIQNLIDNWQAPDSKIVKYKISYTDISNQTEQWIDESIKIDEIKPIDIFLSHVDSLNLDEEKRILAEEAFRELLMSINE
ncbi:MAG TPA: exonuclease SbcCD subunit D C-terminal domain-containing protein [Salinivirgaceae bacterium]|nr:exonuclease SbcCD subunit D C-terminal domain-containing protein [Salinivirgaceae bacterium]